jgi:RNA polymerase primary sigma factor
LQVAIQCYVRGGVWLREGGAIGEKFCTVETAAWILGEPVERTQERVDQWELPVVTGEGGYLIPTSAILELRERLVEERSRGGAFNIGENQPKSERVTGVPQTRSLEVKSGDFEVREFSAPTVAEALAVASAELAVPSGELIYEIKDPGARQHRAIGSRSATIAVRVDISRTAPYLANSIRTNVASPNDEQEPARENSSEEGALEEAKGVRSSGPLKATSSERADTLAEEAWEKSPEEQRARTKASGGYYYTPAQAVKLTRVGVHRLMDAGKLPFIEVRGRRWIPKEAIDEWSRKAPRPKLAHPPKPKFIPAAEESLDSSVPTVDVGSAGAAPVEPAGTAESRSGVHAFLDGPPDEESSPDREAPEPTEKRIEELEEKIVSLKEALEEERSRGRQRDELIMSLWAKLEKSDTQRREADETLPSETQQANSTTRSSGHAARTARLPLYPWQSEALDWWQKRGHRGVVEAVTGAGKTRLAVAAIEHQLRRGEPAVVIVPTKDLLQQWKRELEKRLVGDLNMRVSVGLLGDNRKDTLDDHEVVVATAHSGSRYILLPAGSKGLLIADEVHHYGARRWSRILEEEFDRRLGLTATYERNDSGIEEFLDPYFGGSVFRVDYARALIDDVIAPFKIAFVAVRFSREERRRYEEHDEKAGRYRRKLVKGYGLPEEPFGEFMREVNQLAVGGEGEATGLARAYLNAFSKRRQALAGAQEKFKRVADLSAAVQKADRSILFAQTQEAAAKAVRQMTECGINGAVLTSSMDMSARKQVFAAFEDGEHELVAAPRLLDEGIDVPAADLAIVLASSRSRRQMVQRMGRVVRKKRDGRLARLAVLYVMDSSEDPEVAHEDFLYLVTEVASDIVYFGPKATPKQICDYLNDWRA